MATLATRINSLAAAIRDKFNQVIAAQNAGFAARPRGLYGFCSGKPAASEVIMGGVSPYAFNITQANCYAKSLVAATANTLFTIQNNGANIGSVSFSAGSTTGAVTITAPAVAKDAYVTVHGPAAPDAALADISIRIAE